METREKVVTKTNTTVILKMDELVTILVNAKILPKNIKNIAMEYDSDKLYIYSEESAEQEIIITNEQRELLEKNIFDLYDQQNKHEHLLSLLAQKTLRRHGFKTLQDCVQFTKEGLLKKKYFPKKVVLELEELFKDLKIPF